MLEQYDIRGRTEYQHGSDAVKDKQSDTFSKKIPVLLSRGVARPAALEGHSNIVS